MQTAQRRAEASELATLGRAIEKAIEVRTRLDHEINELSRLSDDQLNLELQQRGIDVAKLVGYSDSVA